MQRDGTEVSDLVVKLYFGTLLITNPSSPKVLKLFKDDAASAGFSKTAACDF